MPTSRVFYAPSVFGLVLSATTAFSQVTTPPLKLSPLPGLKVEDATPTTPADLARIRELIEKLSEIDSPDFGLSATMSGTSFAPLVGFESPGAMILTNHGIKPSETVRDLVALGPKALPMLLESLDSNTSTRLSLSGPVSGFGGMFYETQIAGNPVNEVEQKALSEIPKSSFGTGGEHIESYTVKVGDVCFVIIGQIVGRSYQAVRYQPTAIVLINSPTHDAKLARAVRAIWSSKNPSQHLLDSLLMDYCTDGDFNGQNLDGWSIGSELKVSAAMRLLYYFPHESALLISDRLKKLNVESVGPGSGSYHSPEQMKTFMNREVANGVRTDRFVKAVSWCQEVPVRQALTDVFLRAADPDVITAILPYVALSEADVERIGDLLQNLPGERGTISGDGFNILTALTNFPEQRVKPLFRRYLQADTPQHCVTVCRAVRKTQVHWGIELIAPLLNDRRETGITYRVDAKKEEDSELPVLVCDEAASALNSIDSELSITMAGSRADLDAQILEIQKRLTTSPQ